MPQKAKPGLWVMEGEWSSSVKDVRSVGPILSALSDMGQARYVRRAHQQPEKTFVLQLKNWAQKQHQALHHRIRRASWVAAGRSTWVERVSNSPSSASTFPKPAMKNKILHFGSCSVLDMKPKERARAQTQDRRQGDDRIHC